MTNSPTATEKKHRDNTKTPPKFRLHNDCEPTWTVIWSNDSHPNGIVKPVYEISTFIKTEDKLTTRAERP